MFVVGKSGDSSISELGGLLHLHGKLSILQLQNVRDASAAENAKLRDKNNTKELVFRWDHNVHDLQLEDVLEKLCPHRNTERLTIEKYNGKKFPGWLGDISFSNMVFLRLSDCKNCSSLSSLGQLSCLKELRIAKMERLESIGPEFYGFGPSSINPFKSLCSLWFEDMPNWKHWSSVQVEGGEFPSLQELHTRKCRKQVGKLPIYLPSLKLLHIEECRDLDFLFEDMMLYPELQKLVIKSSCNSLANFLLGFFNKLEYLLIGDCKYLKFMEVSEDHHDQELRFLKKLEVCQCDNLEFFTGRGLLAPNMTYFSVSSCRSLKSMPERMHELLTSLQELHISSCPELKSCPSDGLPPNLHSLSIKNCEHLTPQREWGLDKMASLTCLEIIGGCRNVKSFPEEGLLPVSLTSLQVSDLLELEVLDLKGLQFLPYLNSLKINKCVSLHCLSEGRLPSSLSFLNINECSLLRARCQKEQGEDWPKICHVRYIHIEN